MLKLFFDENISRQYLDGFNLVLFVWKLNRIHFRFNENLISVYDRVLFRYFASCLLVCFAPFEFHLQLKIPLLFNIILNSLLPLLILLVTPLITVVFVRSEHRKQNNEGDNVIKSSKSRLVSQLIYC